MTWKWEGMAFLQTNSIMHGINSGWNVAEPRASFFENEKASAIL
jgi:hypothetical protein